MRLCAFLKETNFIIQLAELGVILLMFSAGMETDLTELKKTGKASFIIAIFGVLIPLIGGFLVAYIFSDLEIVKNSTTNTLLQNICKEAYFNTLFNYRKLSINLCKNIYNTRF